ncbi:MAG: bifunctional acetate--CoA ligase family protein/GNAT family N-acetyltransferase [Acidimicrobiales bacterium]
MYGLSDRTDPTNDRWASDVVLTDGTTARLRPITPGDDDAIRSFHSRQSRESVYFRYFSPRPNLSDDDIRHLTHVDGIDRMAFVAERDGVLIGVARYDRYGDRPVAEVAFFTDDEHNGRGIATLMLEYLAAYAREVGVSGFDAHVLPTNRRMVRVFTQAGFRVSSEFNDGVIEVTLDIEPTEEAARSMEVRARAAERQAVVRLLEPRTVAVIGAGRSRSGIGHRVLRNILTGPNGIPFKGAVYPVHPEAGSVAGVRAYPSVLDIPDQIDLAVVCVPAAEVVAVVEECGRSRVRAAVVISAGFAEAGPEGQAEQARLLATARRFGVRILGPNCLGVVNTADEVSLHATFADIDPLSGRVGLLSQSGTLGAVILESARRKGLGISSFVAVGNKADLSGNDLLQYWMDDDRTDVVLLYLESFGNPRRFGRNVRRVAASKPVFAVRSGAVLDRTETGAAAIDDARPRSGHDGLDDGTIDALLRQTGVVRVPTIAALLDAALVASHQPIPAGPGVVIVGNSGGSASMAADACVDAGLSIAELGEQALTAVGHRRLLGRRSPNPVDLQYDVAPEDYADVLDAVLVDSGGDIALVVHAPYDRDDHDRMSVVLDRAAAEHPEVTLVACVYGPHPPVTAGGVPVFDVPVEAALAVGRVARHGAWRAGEERGEVLVLDDPGAVASAVHEALGGAHRRVVPPEVARTILETAGVHPVPVTVFRSMEELASVVVDGSSALKAERHVPGAATRQGGVDLDLSDADEVREAAADIARALGDEAWPMLLQPMVAPGTDVRISIETHPIVGPVVRVGPGGGAGRFASAPRRVLPLTHIAAEEMLIDSGVAEMLDAESCTKLLDLIRRLAAVVDAAPEVLELACDPVIVRPDAADVVEVRVALQSVRPDSTPPVRRLDAGGS